MPDNSNAMPDSTAMRVALWRAMHVQADPPPHVLEDKIGLQAGCSGGRLTPPPGHGPTRHEPLPCVHLWPAPASSRIWLWNKPATALVSM